ncbi:MAG: BtpA/SgcQ family protein [Vicinamibacteria bacterium]
MALIGAWKSVSKPVVGMLHLPALPGAPAFGGQLESIRAGLWRDAEALVGAGVDGLMLENFGDRPFFPRGVPPWTTAHMAALAVETRRRFDIPLGINVLRNDGRAALAIAHAVGAQFIRVNVLAGARVTDQGVLEGVAHELLRDRKLLGAEETRILADVNVKHSAPLGAVELENEVADLIDRAGADGIIVSGTGTGKAADVEELERVKAVSGETPVFVGSGVSLDSVEDYLALADGFIVGSFFKVDGKVDNPVDATRVKEFLKKLRSR